MDKRLEQLILFAIKKYLTELRVAIKEIFSPGSVKRNSGLLRLMSIEYGTELIGHILKLYDVELTQYNRLVELLEEIADEI